MDVIIAGGRDYYLGKHERVWLDACHRVLALTHVLHGAGRGVDRAAEAWALAHGLTVQAFLAEWNVYGKGAGPIRNTAMIQELLRRQTQNGAHVAVLLFPGNRGTEDTERKARAAGLPILRYPQPNESLRETVPCVTDTAKLAYRDPCGVSVHSGQPRAACHWPSVGETQTEGTYS